MNDCSRCKKEFKYKELQEYDNKHSLLYYLNGKWLGDALYLCKICEIELQEKIAEIWFDVK